MINTTAKKEYKPTSCDTCKYCQMRHNKKIMDNTWNCRIMKYKECYDVTIPKFDVYTDVPSWCPLCQK